MKTMNIELDFRIVAAIMKYFDIDGDGQITLEEIEQKYLSNDLAGELWLVYLVTSERKSIPYFEFVCS